MEVGRRVETIQTTASLRTARILRRVLEIWETCCLSNSSEKPSANADVKTLKDNNSNNDDDGDDDKRKGKCIKKIGRINIRIPN